MIWLGVAFSLAAVAETSYTQQPMGCAADCFGVSTLGSVCKQLSTVTRKQTSLCFLRG
jgi:hypothetical protein